VNQLKDALLEPGARTRVIDDAVRLVDSEVQKKSGMSGLAIKAGYKAVCAIKPTLVREAVDRMLDQWVERLEPFFADWDSAGRNGSFDQYMIARKNEVANALLAVTDERARHSHGTVRKTYEKLRPQGEKNVEAAVPGLATIINQHVR
jgi:hypothetical protein